MQKSREALADSRKSIWKRIENKQWTYCSSFMSKTWFYSLAPLFWFFCFLIRNFNSFCSSFYYCNWPENSHHHAYSRHHANKEWLIFPTIIFLGGEHLASSSTKTAQTFNFKLCTHISNRLLHKTVPTFYLISCSFFIAIIRRVLKA